MNGELTNWCRMAYSCLVKLKSQILNYFGSIFFSGQYDNTTLHKSQALSKC